MAIFSWIEKRFLAGCLNGLGHRCGVIPYYPAYAHGEKLAFSLVWFSFEKDAEKIDGTVNRQ